MLAQLVYSPDFDKKEAEIRVLKAEIAKINSETVPCLQVLLHYP